jgi:hypothetical protein
MCGPFCTSNYHVSLYKIPSFFIYIFRGINPRVKKISLLFSSLKTLCEKKLVSLSKSTFTLSLNNIVLYGNSQQTNFGFEVESTFD